MPKIDTKKEKANKHFTKTKSQNSSLKCGGRLKEYWNWRLDLNGKNMGHDTTILLETRHWEFVFIEGLHLCKVLERCLC